MRVRRPSRRRPSRPRPLRLMARSAAITAAAAVGFVALQGQVTPRADEVRASPMAPRTGEVHASRAAPVTGPKGAAVERARRLVERHGCWTDAAPDPELIPSRAVITPVGEARARVVHADVGFAIWLDDAPGTLHAFCP